MRSGGAERRSPVGLRAESGRSVRPGHYRPGIYDQVCRDASRHPKGDELANEKKTYLVTTNNGDWQQLGEAGMGAMIWELPSDVADGLNEDPYSVYEKLDEHGTAVAEFHTDSSGKLCLVGDVEQFLGEWE